MARNYYVILGVDSDATQDQIKSAYRRKAKKLHPDCYNGSRQPFMDVQEAYEVLGDTARRQAYDDDLCQERPVTPTAGHWEPLRTRRCPVEPLVPTGRPSGSGRPGIGWRSGDPFRDAYGRVWDSWADQAQPGLGWAEDIRVSAVLTSRQALNGGRLHIRLPVQATCPACWGEGGVGFLVCPQCAGTGSVVSEHPVSVSFPAGIVDGSVVRVPLDELGLHNTCLLIEFNVRAW